MLSTHHALSVNYLCYKFEYLQQSFRAIADKSKEKIGHGEVSNSPISGGINFTYLQKKKNFRILMLKSCTFC